jgi:alpha-mannosidase
MSNIVTDKDGASSPVFFIGSDYEYVGLFPAENGRIAVLKSQDGRCVVGYPQRPADEELDLQQKLSAQFEAKGFQRQEAPASCFENFVSHFMRTAGFTRHHVEQAFSLCSR